MGTRATGAAPAARSLKAVVSLYIAAICAAEACVAFVDVAAGALAHAVLVLVLLNHYLVERAARDERQLRGGRPVDALVVLALVPLLRIVSLTVTVEEIPEVLQYVLAGTALFAAAAAAAPVVPGSVRVRRLRTWSPVQIPIALAGVPLGYAAFALTGPDPFAPRLSVADFLLAAVVLLVFTGFAEEIVFRGVLHVGLRSVFGAAAPIGSALLFAAAYLPTGSFPYVGFIALVGLAFAWLVDRTGSLLGVAFAHGLLSVGMLLVWPALVG